MIASWFGVADQGEAFPETLPVTLKRGATLRYGETRISRPPSIPPPARRPAASARPGSPGQGTELQ